jgi:peptidyl-Asp metalloendopeptidase
LLADMPGRHLALAGSLAALLSASGGCLGEGAAPDSPGDLPGPALDGETGAEVRVRSGERLDIDRLIGPGSAQIIVDTGEEELVAVRRARSASGRNQSWFGALEGDEHAPVAFTRTGDSLVGSLRTGERYLTVISHGPDWIAQVQVAASSSLEGAEPIAVAAAQAPLETARVADHTIDLGVVASADALAYYGGADAFAAAMANEVEILNSVMREADVHAQFRLAGILATSYVPDPSQMSLDLRRLRLPGDGYLDEVHAWRDQIGADLVHLVVARASSACGIAHLAHQGNEAISFGVSAINCFFKYTLQHEVGHNLGMVHAPEDGSTTGATSYSYGLKSAMGGFRTLMAYDCPNSSCPRLPRLSNPRQTHNNHPMGSETQDNASTVAETWATVSVIRRAALAASFRVDNRSDDAVFCSGKPLTLEAHRVSGSSYRWLIDGVEVSTAPSLSWQADRAGEYLVSLEVTSGSAVESASMVLALETGPTLVTPSSGICRGSSIELSVEGADEVSWIPSALVSDPNAFTTTATPTESSLFMARMSNQNGCSHEQIILVEVGDEPPTPGLTGPTLARRGGVATYQAESSYSVRWNVTGGTVVADRGHSIDVAWDGEGPHAVEVSAYQVAGCEAPLRLDIVLDDSDLTGGCRSAGGAPASGPALLLLALLATRRRRSRSAAQSGSSW